MRKVLKIILILVIGSILLAGAIIGVRELFITPGASITVTQPDSTTTWLVGNTYEIEWTYEDTENILSRVVIKLYLSGSTDAVETIASSVLVDRRTYSYPVPASLQSSSSYRVKVATTFDESVCGWSAFFAISNPSPPTTTTPPTIPVDDRPPVLSLIKFRGNGMVKNQEPFTISRYTGNKLFFTVRDEQFFQSLDPGWARVILTVYEKLDLGGRNTFLYKEWLDLLAQRDQSEPDEAGWWQVASFEVGPIGSLKWGASYEIEIEMTDHAGNTKRDQGYSFRFVHTLEANDLTVTLTKINDEQLAIEAEFAKTEMIKTVSVQLLNGFGERYLDPDDPTKIFTLEMVKQTETKYQTFFDTPGWGDGYYEVLISVEWSHYADFRTTETTEFETGKVFTITGEETGHTEATDTTPLSFGWSAVLPAFAVVAMVISIVRRRKK